MGWWSDFAPKAIEVVRQALPACHVCGGAGTQPCVECGEVVCYRHAYTNVSRLVTVCSVCMEEAFPNLRELPEGWPYEEAPWEILGVQPDASDTEIKAAQRELSKEAHPDKKGGDAELQSAINLAAQEMLRQ